MKKIKVLALLIIVLVSGVSITSCSKSESDENLFPNAPTEVKAIVSDESSNTVIISWNSVETDDYGATLVSYNIYRSNSVDGEFEKIRENFSPTNMEDKQLSFNTTYYYKVQCISTYPNDVEGNTSEVVEVTTGEASLNPVVSAVAISNGEGETASLDYVRIDWNVELTDGIKEFNIIKDGNTLTTVVATNDRSYSFKDYNVNYDVEYMYTVIAISNDGAEYTGNEEKVTPTQPAAIDRPAPEIISINSSRADKTIDIVFTDVANHSGDLYEIKGEIEGLTEVTTWEQRHVDMGTDADGNKTFGIDCSNLNLDTGATIWFNVQMRIYTQDGWSDWSAKERTFVF